MATSHIATVLVVAALSATASAAANLTAIFGGHLSSGAQILYPTSPNYTTQVQQRWTTWDQPSFIGTIKPATEGDVQTIVKLAVQNNLTFQATGAGHGFSAEFAQVQNAVNIDLGNFKTVSVDAANNRLTVGASNKFQDIFQPLYNAGKQLQTGNIACVGVVGAAIGGGVGPLNGIFGLMADAIQSVRLVTAAGDLITVSQTQYPDLFFGIRGAGANFGIITSATFGIHDEVNNGQVLNADFLFPAAKNQSVLQALASFDSYIPPPLGLVVDLAYNQTSKSAFVLVNFIYFGTQASAQPYLNRFISLNATVSKITSVPWPQLDATASFGQASGPACNNGGYDNVYTLGTKKTDVPSLMSYYADLVAFSQAHPTYVGISALQRYGNAVPVNQNVSYPWRDTKTQLLLINTELDSSINADVDKFQQSARTKLQATSGFSEQHIYVNYAHGDEGPKAWYGCFLPKLQALKRKWDPKNVFPGGHSLF